MPETEVETPAVPATETVKEEAVKADETKEEKKDQEKTGDESKETKTEKKKEKKVKEPAAPPPPAVHKKDFEKDVVYVYQFNRTAAVPSISPACLKLETWIKLNGIKYEVSRASSGLSIFQLRATCRVLPPPPLDHDSTPLRESQAASMPSASFHLATEVYFDHIHMCICTYHMNMEPRRCAWYVRRCCSPLPLPTRVWP
jgi:hypothetical protein